MTDFSILSQSLTLQGGVCAAMGSPFSAGLLERAASALESEASLRALFAPWAEAKRQALFAEAVALRWLGALHEAALAEPDSTLALAYPRGGQPGDPESAWRAAVALMRSRADGLALFMAHEPQTNEPRRSAVLLPGFLEIAASTGLPMRVLELGASAGLNQLWDQRRYRLGEVATWGVNEASVGIETDWRGAPPRLDAPVAVIERAACDRSPIDITDAVQRRRLRAYVWPDQLVRLALLDAAIAQTLAGGIIVERQDAVAWARRMAAPREGLATVVFHSVFLQYMPAASQKALTETLASFGASASRAAPLAWLRMEPAPANPATMQLCLTLWPGGEERLLATAHPHGAWIEWLA